MWACWIERERRPSRTCVLLTTSRGFVCRKQPAASQGRRQGVKGEALVDVAMSRYVIVSLCRSPCSQRHFRVSNDLKTLCWLPTKKTNDFRT
jgi:hypothetical protein